MMKRFFKFLLQNALIAVISTSFTFLILLVILFGVIASVAQKQPSFPKEAVLAVDLSMNLIDTPPGLDIEDMVRQVVGDEAPMDYNIRDIIETIDRAKNDRRVKAILLQGSFQPSGYGCSYPVLSEFRNALIDFKESGKKIVAYSINPSPRDLYVMAIADEFYLNKSGSLILSGLYSERMYYKNALEKFGVGVQAVRVGEFKSAIEPYTRTNMSDEAREASELLLHDLWNQVLRDITTVREMDLEKTRQLINNQPILYAEEVAEAGFCDDTVTHIDVRNRLMEISGENQDTHSYNHISLDQYIFEKEQFGKKPSGAGVAVVYAEGAIVGGEGEDNQVGAERMVQNLREARQNPDIKAIVLRVNSPGGGATASKLIQDELLEIKKQQIPLIVSMGGYAASGGYLISESADRIFCHPHTVTGSIGIFGLLMNFGEGANKLGITFDEVKTNRNGDLMSISKPKSDEQIAMIQGYLSDFYETWTKDVAAFRAQSVDHIRSIAGGRVWSGNQALELGLVDELGGLTEAISFAAEAAGFEEEYATYDYPRKMTEDEAIAAAFGLAQAHLNKAAISPTGSQLKKWMESIDRIVNQFDDPIGAYAYSAFEYR